jgi:hypothetical protein
VAGLVKGSTENGTDPAGADDADVEPGGPLRRRGQVIHS